jgi:hypothetical protein
MKEFNVNPKLDYLHDLDNSLKELNSSLDEWKKKIVKEFSEKIRLQVHSESLDIKNSLLEEVKTLKESLKKNILIHYDEQSKSFTKLIEKHKLESVKEVKTEIDNLKQEQEKFKSAAEIVIEDTINDYLQQQHGPIKELHSIISKAEELDDQVSKLEDRLQFFRRDYSIMNEQIINFINLPHALNEIRDRMLKLETKIEIWRNSST